MASLPVFGWLEYREDGCFPVMIIEGWGTISCGFFGGIMGLGLTIFTGYLCCKVLLAAFEK